MQIGRDLAAWLADPMRRSRARQATEQAAARMADHPRLKKLNARLDAAADADVGVRAITELFADTDWVAEFVADHVAAAKDDPFFTPPYRAIRSALHDAALLVNRPEASIALGIMSPDRIAAHKASTRGQGSVNFSGRRVILKFIEAGGIELSIWHAPPASDDFTAAAADHCHLIGTQRFTDGELIAFDTGRESFIIERANSPVTMLQGEVRIDGPPVAREYDATSGGLVASSGAREADTRIQMMLTFLRCQSRRDADRQFARFARRGPFHLRWHAMREWLALDAAAAWPVLESMAAEDPHPEIRCAAASVIARHGRQAA